MPVGTQELYDEALASLRRMQALMWIRCRGLVSLVRN